MASFKYKGQLNGAENPICVDIIVGASGTITVGGAVIMDSLSNGGGVLAATTGVAVTGICVGLYKDQIPLENVDAATLAGAYTKSTQVFVATSTNTTVDMVYAKVVVDPMALWENDSAGDLVLADEYKYFDLLSATQIADQSGHDTAGTFQLIRRDVDDASKGTFRIAESKLYSIV